MGKKEKVVEVKPPTDFFKGVQVDLKTVKTAVLNLESTEDSVLTKCASSIFNFIVKDREANAPVIHEMGSIQKLANLIDYNDELVRRFTLQALAIMCDQPIIKQALVLIKDQLLPKLFLIIVDQDVVAVEFAIMIIASLSTVSKIKDDLVEDERVEDMVTLFKYVDPDIKKHTLHIIYNLANDFNIRPVLCDLSRPIMEFCLTNIISEYKVIQELSLGIVYSICVEEEAFEVFVELDGIKKLFLFIQNKEYLDLHENALKTFEHVWKWERHRNTFLQNGNFERLILNTIQLLDTPEGERTASTLMDVIYNTNFKMQNVQLIPICLELISKLLQSSNEKLKLATLKAVTVLSQQSTFRELFYDHGLTQKVVNLISNEQTRKFAILASAQLIKDNQNNRVQLISQSQSGTFIQLLSQENDHDLIVGILSILVVLGVDDEPYQKEILDLGLLQSLTVRFNSNIFLVNLLDVLKIYVKTVEATKVIISNNVMLRIISLVEAKHEIVRTKAAKLIKKLSYNSFVFEYLINHNTIELLKKVNKSDHLRSHSSEEALSCILEFNLSYKYAFDRYLGQTNQISDGFYDCGYQTYDSLDKLATQNNAIIIINMKSDKEDMLEDLEVVKITNFLHKWRTSSSEDTQSKKSDKTDKSSKKGKGKKKTKAETERLSTKLEAPDMSQRPSRVALTPENDESTVSLIGQDTGSKQIEPEYDVALYDFLDQIEASLTAEDSPKGTLEQINIIGKAIYERFGGKRTENYLIELIGIQRARDSPIIPLGSISVGVYRERALLFKLVCDIYSIPVSLQRGDYGKVWNSFYLHEKQYIIDLMHSPGSILDIESPEAKQYISFG